MDAILIRWLEALFAHSRISPYAIARFFGTGCVLLWVFAAAILALDDKPTVTVLAAFLSIWWLFRVYGCAKQAEQENDRGFCNSLKASCRIYRYFFLAAVIFAACIFNIFCLCVWGLGVLFEYTVALNWTPPPARQFWLFRAVRGAA